ncbi:hypothetical protein L1994_00745 [Methanomicrobium antiquum]|uniref:Uncharacterized protein n=1 Tax=Methanomicrobium antiquum TaxID=487686 RepID=A0AAF0JTY7_9EURY|nr:hypothetical protein [Methanomicrobium antiquum]MDD3978425.1 hypothetical protein [Methanomicrobium sp.]WFN36958.1 hypothetical protein L1994_00745 [Methanomicrobium antiquum]
MSEKLVYGGAILSGGSLIISGLLIALMILVKNEGNSPGDFIYILPLMALLLIAGVAAIIYGSRDENTKP